MRLVVIKRAKPDPKPGLGHAISRKGFQRGEHLCATAANRRRAVHTGRENPGSQAADIPRITLLRLGETLQMGLEAIHDRDLFTLHEIEALVGIEYLGDHLLRASDHRHQRPFGIAERMEQGQIVQDDVVPRDGHSESALLDVSYELVAVDDAFRKSGRARGIHDEDRIVGINRSGPRLQLGIADLPAGTLHLGPGHGAAVISLPRITSRRISGKLGSWMARPEGSRATTWRTMPR